MDLNSVPEEQRGRVIQVIRKMSVYQLSTAVKSYVQKSEKIPQDAGITIAVMLLLQTMYNRVSNQDEKAKSDVGYEAFKKAFKKTHPASLEEARCYLEYSIKLMNEMSIETGMGEGPNNLS